MPKVKMKGDVKLNYLERSAKRKRVDPCPEKYRTESEIPVTPKRRPSSSGSNSTLSSSRHGSTMSSRLEELAEPRLSSSWKKPIKSKYSRRRFENQRRRDDDERISLSLDGEEVSVKSASKPWKGRLSPKLSKLISGISPTARDVLKKKAREMCPQRDDPDSCLDSRAPDIFATPIIASLLNHPFHSSCPPASVVKFSMLSLQREVQRLTDKLAAKDECISELQAKIEESENRQRGEIVLYREIDERRERSIAVQRLNQALSPELLTNMTGNSESPSGRTKGTGHCTSGRNIKSFSPLLHDENNDCGELVLRLREELDSKKEEVEFLKLENEIQMQQLSSRDDRPEMKELVSSLKELQKECSSLRRSSAGLRRSSVKYIRQAEKVMARNYEKIMNYVHEELESVREAAHAMLQSELEEARRENSKLEADLKEADMRRVSIESCRSSVESLRLANDEMDKALGKRPPEMEGGWDHFSARLQRALRVSPETPPHMGSEQDEDNFVDALCTLEDETM